jgi:hypothetical protein
MLGRQQPLGHEELEKLMLARSKYQGSKSAAALPLAVGCGAAGNHHETTHRESETSSRESTPKARRAVTRHS